MYNMICGLSANSGEMYVYILLPVGQCTPDKNVTFVSDVMPRQ